MHGLGWKCWDLGPQSSPLPITDGSCRQTPQLPHPLAGAFLRHFYTAAPGGLPRNEAPLVHGSNTSLSGSYTLFLISPLPYHCNLCSPLPPPHLPIMTLYLNVCFRVCFWGSQQRRSPLFVFALCLHSRHSPYSNVWCVAMASLL